MSKAKKVAGANVPKATRIFHDTGEKPTTYVTSLRRSVMLAFNSFQQKV
jgi:hypothetical protein